MTGATARHLLDLVKAHFEDTIPRSKLGIIAAVITTIAAIILFPVLVYTAAQHEGVPANQLAHQADPTRNEIQGVNALEPDEFVELNAWCIADRLTFLREDQNRIFDYRFPYGPGEINRLESAFSDWLTENQENATSNCLLVVLNALSEQLGPVYPGDFSSLLVSGQVVLEVNDNYLTCNLENYDQRQQSDELRPLGRWQLDPTELTWWVIDNETGQKTPFMRYSTGDLLSECVGYETVTSTTTVIVEESTSTDSSIEVTTTVTAMTTMTLESTSTTSTTTPTTSSTSTTSTTTPTTSSTSTTSTTTPTTSSTSTTSTTTSTTTGVEEPVVTGAIGCANGQWEITSLNVVEGKVDRFSHQVGDPAERAPDGAGAIVVTFWWNNETSQSVIAISSPDGDRCP